MELEARDVTFYYPGKKKHPVLDHVNLTIAPGERVGLKGKSGRGKTTLCRLLAGYEAPKGGQVLLDGKEIRAYRGVCPVQMIWQHPETAVDPRLRMKETLAEAGIRLSGTRGSGRNGWTGSPPNCPAGSCSGSVLPERCARA